MRAPELATLEKFCQAFHVTIQEVSGFMAEPNFMDRVVRDTTAWKSATRDVIAAVKRNAEDGTRSDQMRFVAAYLKIVEHPAAEAIEELASLK
jgi:hypothetical protein